MTKNKKSGRLAGKNVLVTGAAQGIGRASALLMAQEGATVWATDRNSEAMQDLLEHGLYVEQMDVTDSARIAALQVQLPTFDVLFNCAGYVHSGTILDCSESDWDKTHNTNIKGMFLTTKAFLPAMLKNGYGSIINMSSMASHIKGVENRFAYSASKAAVIGFTKSIAADFIKNGIRCNAVCPGIIDTPSLRERLSCAPDPEKATHEFIARQPTGKLGQAHEIAPLIVYLASDEASFVTGCAYSIDGGISL